MDSSESSQIPANKNKLDVSVDLRLISLVLLIALFACILMWQPWQNSANANQRTVRVTGTATVRETPDEFIFNPTYQFETASKDLSLAALTQKSNEVIAGLKKLGVVDKDIKSNSNGFENYGFADDKSETLIYSLQLTVTVKEKDLVQKVQDYLLSTEPTGSVSPIASFSESRRKEIENKGRSQAITEARKKADQTAEELGFKVSKVKSVDDTNQNIGIFPMDNRAMSSPELSSDGTKPVPDLTVQPGQNDLNYSINVVYYIR